MSPHPRADAPCPGNGTGFAFRLLSTLTLSAVFPSTKSAGRSDDEIDQTGRTVASFVFADYLGYAEYRESLHGPPPY